MASGTVVAQIIGVAIYPVISRLFDPEGFGLLGVFLSVINIVGANASFRYHQAIVIAEEDEHAASVFLLSLGGTLITTIASVLILWLGADTFAAWLNEPAFVDFALWIPPGIFLVSLSFTLKQWHIRFKKFGSASAGEAFLSFTNSASQLALGFSGFVKGIHLIYSSLLGRAIEVLSYLIQFPARYLFRSSSVFSLQKIKVQAKEFKKFPQFSTLSGIINKIGWELPSFLLVGFYDISIAGFYFFGHRLLRLPVSVLGGSIGQVFLQRAAVAYRGEGLEEISTLTVKRLIQIGFIPFVILTFIAPDAFTLIFGEEWSEAGVYTSILSLWTFLWFLSGPLSGIFSITNQQDVMFRYQIIIFIARLTALLIGGYFFEPRISILLFAIAGILSYLYLFKRILRISEIHFRTLLGKMPYIFTSLLIIVSVLSATIALDVSNLITTVVGVATVMFYYLFLFKKEPDIKTLLKNLKK